MAGARVLADQAPAPASKRVIPEIVVPTHDQIAELAYSYWEARGGVDGSPWEDWFRAERELTGRER